MQVNSIVSNTNQKVSFQAKPEVKADANKIQNGKKKLALALGLLGAAGAAGVAIAMNVKKGKLVNATDVIQEGKEIILKKSKNFQVDSSSYKTVTDAHGKSKTFLKEIGTYSNPKFRNGEKIDLVKLTDLETGKTASLNKVKVDVEPKDYVKKGHMFIDGKKVATTSEVSRRFPEGERLRSVIEGSFDKETKILTQTEKYCSLLGDGNINYCEGKFNKILTDKTTGEKVVIEFIDNKPRYMESFMTKYPDNFTEEAKKRGLDPLKNGMGVSLRADRSHYNLIFDREISNPKLNEAVKKLFDL